MTDKENKNLRNIVLNMLAETLDKGVFSHVVVNETFAAHELTGQERSFVSRLYLGVLERLIYIDYCINRVSKTSTAKMKPIVLNILRMSVYQLLFMDGVPAHAAINEAGKLAKKRGFSQLVPFVNGVLRSIQRDGREAAEENMPVNVKLSVPKWIYEMVSANYGEERADVFFRNSLNTDSRLTIRLNARNGVEGDADKIVRSLEAEGCSLCPADGERSGYYLSGFGSLTGLKAYRDGLFSVQDLSSIRAALAGCRELAADGVNAPLIIDVCGAPGGKSITAAQQFPEGRVITRDLSETKTALIRENVQRLGLKAICPQVWDAMVMDESLEEQADMVIADLPCSGLGVIGGKPDIKFRIRQKDLASLEKLQRDILGVVYRYVKPGGVLLYSTCTINPGENKENARWISEELPFDLAREEQILEEGDGFYIAVFRRQRK